MNRKRILTILAATMTLAIASAIVFVRAQQQGSSPGTLDWYAEQAQAEGVSSWEFGSGIFEYVEPKLWDDVLATQSFVIAEPIEARSYPNHNATGIFTWYRFRVLETLSQKDVSVCYTCSIPTVLPSDFSAPQANEIVLEKYSGGLSHNGRWLSAVEPSFPEYVMGQRYLLILDLNPADRSGSIRMGPLGIYKINSSGIMTCVCEDASRENPYRDVLTARYGNSVDQLRTALNGAP